MTVVEAVLGWTLFALWLGSLLLHVGSIAAALSQASFRRGRAAPVPARPPVSVLVPTREPYPTFRERLAELAALRYPEFEVIVSSERAYPTVKSAIDALAPEHAARVRWIVDGTRHTPNAKVNVLVAAYRAAANDLILLTDDNVRSPPDRIDALLPHLHGRVGLVSTVAVGTEPRSFAAEVEASLMNGYGARFLLAADRIGRSIAMGITLLFRRRDLDRAGGMATLARGMAMDSVIRERLAAIGVETALAPAYSLQPLGRRSMGPVLARQLRWMAARRWHAPFPFWTEPLHGAVVAGLAAAGAAQLLRGDAAILAMVATWLVWLGLDVTVTRAFGWPASWRYPLAWATREILIPIIWVMALVKRSVAWRGNQVMLRPPVEAGGKD